MDVSNHCHICQHWHVCYMCKLSGITCWCGHVSSHMWHSWEKSNVRMKFLNVNMYVDICVHTWDISKHCYMSGLAYVFECMTLVRRNACLSESIWSNMIYFIMFQCDSSEHMFIHRFHVWHLLTWLHIGVGMNVHTHEISKYENMCLHMGHCWMLTFTCFHVQECLCMWCFSALAYVGIYTLGNMCDLSWHSHMSALQAFSHTCHCQAESSNKWYWWVLSHMWLNTYVHTHRVSENCHILIWCFWVPSHFGMSMCAHTWNVSNCQLISLWECIFIPVHRGLPIIT